MVSIDEKKLNDMLAEFILATKLCRDIFNDAPRVGAEVDEPEGARVVVWSDTLAKILAESFDNLHTGLTQIQSGLRRMNDEQNATQ